MCIQVWEHGGKVTTGVEMVELKDEELDDVYDYIRRPVGTRLMDAYLLEHPELEDSDEVES